MRQRIIRQHNQAILAQGAQYVTYWKVLLGPELCPLSGFEKKKSETGFLSAIGWNGEMAHTKTTRLKELFSTCRPLDNTYCKQTQMSRWLPILFHEDEKTLIFRNILYLRTLNTDRAEKSSKHKM